MDIDWGAVFQAGTQLAGAIAQSQAAKAKGRADEARITNEYDRGTVDRYATDKSIDLDALMRGYQAELERSKGQLAEYAARLDAPQQRASNSVRGDILANVQDVGVSAPRGVNVTSFSGGLRPSLLSGNSRALGDVMSKEALLSELANDEPMPYSGMRPVDVSPILNRRAPGQTPLQEPSAMDRVMQNIAQWGSLAGTVANAYQPSPTRAGVLAGQSLPTGTASGLMPAPSSNPFA